MAAKWKTLHVMELFRPKCYFLIGSSKAAVERVAPSRLSEASAFKNDTFSAKRRNGVNRYGWYSIAHTIVTVP